MPSPWDDLEATLASLPLNADCRCSDCWQEALERAEKYNTDPYCEYDRVYFISHIWDGI